jgi:hypothetical protein
MKTVSVSANISYTYLVDVPDDADFSNDEVFNSVVIADPFWASVYKTMPYGWDPRVSAGIINIVDDETGEILWEGD